MEKINVIVFGTVMVQLGIKCALEGLSDFTFAGATNTTGELRALLKATDSPSLVLDESSLNILDQFKGGEEEEMPIILWTWKNLSVRRKRQLAVKGICYILPLETTMNDLVHSLKETRDVTAARIKMIGEDALPLLTIEKVQSLARREREVYQLIIAGLRNEEIATRLKIGVGTVKMYNKGIFKKCGVGDRNLLKLQFALFGDSSVIQ